MWGWWGDGLSTLMLEKYRVLLRADLTSEGR
jgi:hypothetical protein